MRVKEHLQCDTSAVSLTSAVLLSDKDVGKIKMKKRKDFVHFLGNTLNSEALSAKGKQPRSN